MPNKLKRLKMKDIKRIIASLMSDFNKYLLNNHDAYAKYYIEPVYDTYQANQLRLIVREKIQHFPEQSGDTVDNVNGEFLITIERIPYKSKQEDMGMVKELREKTGAGMWDCREALRISDWDMELAEQQLKSTAFGIRMNWCLHDEWIVEEE